MNKREIHIGHACFFMASSVEIETVILLVTSKTTALGVAEIEIDGAVEESAGRMLILTGGDNGGELSLSSSRKVRMCKNLRISFIDSSSHFAASAISVTVKLLLTIIS